MDHWLKGIDTGYLDEPPIKMYVTGGDYWRFENEWPLKKTKFTKFYLRSWGRLLEGEPVPGDDDEPSCFVQEPLNVTSDVKSVKFTSPALPKDTTVIGPMAIYWYAAIDQEDTTWNVRLRDLDSSGKTVPVCPPQQFDLSDRCWLRASYRTLDKKMSLPYRPWHTAKRDLCVPGQVYQNAINLDSTSHVFKEGHHIQVEICCMDNVPGYLHLCNSKTTLHKIYHSAQYPSYLLLPIIPE
jgi:predicted acyl esterase